MMAWLFLAHGCFSTEKVVADDMLPLSNMVALTFLSSR